MPKISKYYKVVQPIPQSKVIQDSEDLTGGNLYAAYSWYQRLVQGSSTRQTRYREYDTMDEDVDVAIALDTIAEEMTGINENTGMPFKLDVYGDVDSPSPELIHTLSICLRQWSQIHSWTSRLFPIARNLIKYGDCFFKRKNKAKKWEHLHPRHVLAAVVAKDDVTKVIGWQIRTNFKETKGSPFVGSVHYGQEFETQFLSADDIIRFTTNDDMSEMAPFGESVLRAVYRSHKQKILLEDSIIIYRVTRAPERRVFKIDVGKMPPMRVKQYLEQIKNDMKQKKIPSRGGDGNQVESVYNAHSAQEDFFFAQRCLNLQEKIPLLDGRILTLEQLIQEHNDGKTNFVYSVDQSTGEFIPGEIEWAGVTRKNARQVEVTLDNGETIKCTPDHKFVLRDGSECEAQNLQPDCSLMPLYTKKVKTNKKQKKCLYERILNNSTGKWEFTHLLVSPKKDKTKVIHHIDYNPSNNNPTNLVELTHEDHWKFHHSPNGHTLGRLWREEREKMIKSINDYHVNKTEQQQETIVKRNTINGKQTWFKHKDLIIKQLQENRDNFKMSLSEEEYVTHFKTMSRKYWDNISDADIKQRSKKQIEYNKKRKSYKINDEMFTIFKELIYRGNDSLPKIVNALRTCDEFRAAFSDNNRQLDNINKVKFSNVFVYKLCNYGGYENFQDFKTSHKINHKVVKVEWLDERSDTGCLTIKDPGQNHNFALEAGVYVKNSDGKGSTVETLPGGSNLGELTDLEYFEHKVARGLRIPESYWARKSNKEKPIFNDGRLGQAYIEELRFSKYIQRLQSHVEEVVDREFKKFLRDLNLNVDESSFSLKLCEPINFSKYRQQELDNQRLNTLANAANYDVLSKRFILERFLQLSKDEVALNERLLAQERGINIENDPNYINKLYNTSGGEYSGDFGSITGSGSPMSSESGNDLDSSTPEADSDLDSET